MNKFFLLLQEKNKWLHLIVIVFLTLALQVGLWFLFFILAWAQFGEGENSKFYSPWTGKGIIIAACLSIELILLLLIKHAVKNNNRSEAKSYLINAIMVLLFFVAIVFLEH